MLQLDTAFCHFTLDISNVLTFNLSLKFKVYTRHWFVTNSWGIISVKEYINRQKIVCCPPMHYEDDTSKLSFQETNLYDYMQTNQWPTTQQQTNSQSQVPPCKLCLWGITRPKVTPTSPVVCRPITIHWPFSRACLASAMMVGTFIPRLKHKVHIIFLNIAGTFCKLKRSPLLLLFSWNKKLLMVIVGTITK